MFIEEYRAKMASGTPVRSFDTSTMALTREIRVYDLISQAGGLSDKAGNVIQLIHTQEPEGVETIQVAVDPQTGAQPRGTRWRFRECARSRNHLRFRQRE
ncbi:MAG: hypothetical protein U0X75_09785 [Acidobacteriota bacterium]